MFILASTCKLTMRTVHTYSTYGTPHYVTLQYGAAHICAQSVHTACTVHLEHTALTVPAVQASIHPCPATHI